MDGVVVDLEEPSFPTMPGMTVCLAVCGLVGKLSP